MWWPVTISINTAKSYAAKEIDGFPLTWNLTQLESRLLARLILDSPNPSTHHDIATAIYARRTHNKRGAICVHISRLRKKIDPLGMTINNVYPIGYIITMRDGS